VLIQDETLEGERLEKLFTAPVPELQEAAASS